MCTRPCFGYMCTDVAHSPLLAALFGESSSMRPSTSSFKSVSSLLEKLGLESRLKDLNDATLIAPSDVVSGTCCVEQHRKWDGCAIAEVEL